MSVGGRGSNRSGRNFWRAWYITDSDAFHRIDSVLQNERSIPHDSDGDFLAICGTWAEIRSVFRLADVPLPADYLTYTVAEWKERTSFDD